MKPISNKIATQIMRLRHRGASYKEIAKKVCVGVATSYKYAKSVNVSLAGTRRLKQKLKKKQTLFKHSYATPKEIPVIRKLTLSKVRIIAHCLFDGSVTVSNGDYAIKYTNASWKLIKQFMIDMHDVYGLDPAYIELNDGKNHPWWEVKYRSKKAVEDLLRYSPSYSTSDNVRLPKGVARKRGFVRAFLRAFWEDEGCATCDGRLIGTLKSRRLIYDIEQLHRKLRIDCFSKSKSPCYTIYVRREPENFRRFQRELGFGESIVTRGKFIGFKREVVLDYIIAKLTSGI